MGKQLKRGRKRLKDRVKPLTIYVKESAIKIKGGADACRLRLREFFDEMANAEV